MMAGCDTLLMVGSSFPYPEFLPEEGQARAVQIDIDGRQLSIRYPMEVNLIGDSKETLRALIPLLQRKTDRTWREKLEASIRDWWTLMDARAMDDAVNGINPRRVFHELSKRLPDDCILSADSGSTASWYAQHVRFRARHDGIAVGQSGHDGSRRSVRDRGEVRVSRSRGHRLLRRRRDADERHWRAADGGEVLEGVERSAPRSSASSTITT